MSFRSFLSVIGFTIATLCVAVISPSYASPPIVRDVMLTAPWLPPTDEIRLQAAIADEAASLQVDATLNVRLRLIDIRTALEDTSRLHGDLG